MKKTVLSWLLFVSLLAVGCDDNVLPDNTVNKVEGRQVDIIEKVNPNDNYRAEVESFCDAERDYYMFSMGTIENVPIEILLLWWKRRNRADILTDEHNSLKRLNDSAECRAEKNGMGELCRDKRICLGEIFKNF